MPSPLHLHLGECLPRGAFPTPRDGRLREFPRALLLVSLLFCMICTSCGAVGSGPAPAPPPLITITVTPSSAEVFQGDKKQFSVKVENGSSSGVNWQVNGTTGGGSTVGIIDSTGKYTAPSSVSNQMVVTVTAVLQSDSTKAGSASVTVLSPSSFTGPLLVSPALSSVTTSQTLLFQVSTPGTSISNNDVNWAVDGGTITPDGQFTPPSAPGAYTVKASLPNAVGFATVEVTDFPGMLTWRDNNFRSGENKWELALTPGPLGSPGAVSPSTFGKLFSCPIDGYAYAQPLYVPNLRIGNKMYNVIFVATENDSVFAFDADANANPCKPLWKTSLIPTRSQAVSSVNTEIEPFVGITGTPVIDLSASVLYVVAESQTINGAPDSCSMTSKYCHFLFALDLSTGQPIIRPEGAGIVTLAGQSSVFDPSEENQRAALLLDNGTVYIAFGSSGGLCVLPPPPGELGPCPYHGWLFGYDSSSLRQVGAFNVTPNLGQGGIWQSGGGPSADSNHNVFVVTGDGPFDVDRGGMSYSDTFLRFGIADGLSTVADFFTPCDQVALEAAGQDVGSSAPVLVLNSLSQPDLLIGGSKNGSLYVVNPSDMGGYDNTCTGDLLPRVQVLPLGAGPILSSPLFWNDFVYVAPGNSNLMSFHMSGGILAAPPPASQSPETLGPQGATPVISSNGTSNAILWLIDSSGALATPNAPAILRAYDPNNLSNEIYNSATVTPRDQAGLAVKFTVPTVANGKVYVGTQTELDVYGLLQ
jgi:hypothetical protein